MRYRLITSRLVGGRSIVISMSVCLSVCPLAYRKIHMPNFTNFLYFLSFVSVAQSFSDDSARRQVLPVL